MNRDGFIKKYYIIHSNFLKRHKRIIHYIKKIINVSIYHIHLKKKKTENLQDKVSLKSYLFQFFLGQCQIANLAIKDR